MDQAQSGELNWRLSAHPITLLFFLGFRIGELRPTCYDDFPKLMWGRRQSPDVFIRRPFHKKLVSSRPIFFVSSAFSNNTLRKFDYSILVFIITLLLLSADFYYLKNIAGRRLVGLRWWNEVNTSTGESHWVFESSDPNVRVINATDKRFFWLTLYVTPALWIGLAILAVVRLQNVIWLSLVGRFESTAVVFCQVRIYYADEHQLL